MLEKFDADRYYIVLGYTDLRLGINGLANLVQSQYQLDPFTKSMFLFCGRKADRYKALYWDKDGFVLLYKRLEKGRYQWPRTAQEVQELSLQQLRWLMEGLSIYQPRAHKPVESLKYV